MPRPNVRFPDPKVLRQTTAGEAWPRPYATEPDRHSYRGKNARPRARGEGQEDSRKISGLK